MLIVLKHGSKYKTCTCDTCSAELAYLDKEVESVATCTPMRVEDHDKTKEVKQRLSERGESTDIVYFYEYIHCPECTGMIFTSSKILTGFEAEMHRRCGHLL